MRSGQKIGVFILALILPISALAISEAPETQVVVLLHGLARSEKSMEPMQEALQKAGYRVCNLSYPSTKYTVEVLAYEHVLPAIKKCTKESSQPVNFVTHSLGGILIRQLKTGDSSLHVGRVVMLGPPNGGSEVVDKLGGWNIFQWINGPAGQQLGTDANAKPRSLGPADFELGIIAGENSINLILSRLIPGKDDGKVSIENAKLKGMQDFMVMPVSHPFLMRNKAVIEQTLAFLKTGQFLREP